MRCALAPREAPGPQLWQQRGSRALSCAAQAIEEATGKIYNGKGKDGKKIDKGTAARSKRSPPPLGSGRPRRRCHLGARLTALACPALPGGQAGPLVTAPLPRVLERAASTAADAAHV